MLKYQRSKHDLIMEELHDIVNF